MASEFDDFLSDFYTQWNTARGLFSSAQTSWNQAQTSWDAGDDHIAIGKILDGLHKCADSHIKLMDTYTYEYPRFNITKLFDLIGTFMAEAGEPPEYELTMAALLSVMITATDDEYKNFIGLVDAYRVGLWDKPFNAEYYAALARGFKG